MQALSRSAASKLFQIQRGKRLNQVCRSFSSKKPPKQPQKCRRLPRVFNSDKEDERYQLGPQQFRQLTPEESAEAIRKKYGLLESDGPDIATLAKLTENVWGAFTLGNSVVLRLKINNQVIDVPLVTEEPSVVAAIGLLSNFSALRALVSNGIIEGHMALHNQAHTPPLQDENNNKKMSDLQQPFKQIGERQGHNRGRKVGG